MPLTSIVSFTNMSLQAVDLSSTESPDKECNSCTANSGSTVWRDPAHSLTGEPSQCCSVWIPWCDFAGRFDDHHITLTRGGRILYYLWQARHPDGDFVRYSTTGYESPGSVLPGDSRVTGDGACGLTLHGDDSLHLWKPDAGVRIPHLPQALHDEHMHWHMTTHSGGDFLQFHRDFLARFHAWYDVQPFADQSLVRAWRALPPEFAQPGDPEAAKFFAQVSDLETNLYRWKTQNEFGAMLQGSLHRWLHHVPITTVYRDIEITNFSTAPYSRHFYQLHGLIDLWWQRWIDGRSAVFVSQQGIPASLLPGQRFTATVVMRNTGRFTWPARGTVRLGSQSPQDNTTWGTSRVTLASPVAPESSATFTIAAVAPPTPGSHVFQWRMVDEGTAWFGSPTSSARVTVRPPDDKVTVPGVVGLSRAEATIEIRGAGLTPAFTGAGVGVFSQAPAGGVRVAKASTVACRLRGRPDD